MDTIKLVVFLIVVLIVTLLPQFFGWIGYRLLHRMPRFWRAAVAVGLPPLVFFAFVYPFARHAQKEAAASLIPMAAAGGVLFIYLYLLVGMILNFLFGLTVQLVLLYRRHRQPRIEAAYNPSIFGLQE